MYVRALNSEVRITAGEKWTLKYYEMVCLSLITKPYCLYHTSQADQEVEAGEEKWTHSPWETRQELTLGMKVKKCHCLLPAYESIPWRASLFSLANQIV